MYLHVYSGIQGCMASKRVSDSNENEHGNSNGIRIFMHTWGLGLTCLVVGRE